MVPRRSAVSSRYDVDLATEDGTGTTIPLVVANMTAVAGRRMSETVARRGGLAVLPQDIPNVVVGEVVSWVKQRHPLYETPIVLHPEQTVGDALSLIPKRAHRAACVVDQGRPVGLVTPEDCSGRDRFAQVRDVMSSDLLTIPDGTDARAGFDILDQARRRIAPVVAADGTLRGVLSRQGALRSTVYRPALDGRGRLRDRCRDRRRRDGGRPGEGSAGSGSRLFGSRHGPRPPGPHARGVVGGQGARPVGAGRRRATSCRPRERGSSSRPGPTS